MLDYKLPMVDWCPLSFLENNTAAESRNQYRDTNTKKITFALKDQLVCLFPFLPKHPASTNMLLGKPTTPLTWFAQSSSWFLHNPLQIILIIEVFCKEKRTYFAREGGNSWCDCNQTAQGFQFLFSLGSNWLLLCRDVHTVAEEISLVGLLMPSSPS